MNAIDKLKGIGLVLCSFCQNIHRGDEWIVVVKNPLNIPLKTITKVVECEGYKVRQLAMPTEDYMSIVFIKL